MFNHFFSAFFRGENLTTLALPDEGKGNASKRAPYEGAAKRFSMHQSMWRHDKTHRPLKGKRLTTFCASLALLQILQNVFAVHRFAQGAADWRSGPRWSIISVFCPVHPFATTWHFPSRGNEKIGGTEYCVTYDTDSQSRNAPCVPFRGRGPRSGEGVDSGKNDYDT